MFNLNEKVAIVTGCNKGLGYGMAVGLAKAGADIVGVNRSDDNDIKNTVEALGKRYLSIKADLNIN